MKEKTTNFGRFKEEVERLEKEKKDSISTWSAKLDWHQAKHAKMKMDAREKEKLFKEKERQMDNDKQKVDVEWNRKLSELEAEKERLDISLKERLAVVEAERNQLATTVEEQKEELTKVKSEKEEQVERWKDALATERIETQRLKAMNKWQMTTMRAAASKGVLLQEEQLAVPPELKTPDQKEDVAWAEVDRLTALLKEKEAEAENVKASLATEKKESLRLKAVAKWQSATMRAAASKGTPLKEINVALPPELKTPEEKRSPVFVGDSNVVVETRPASASRVPGVARRISATAESSSSSRPSSPRADARVASPRPLSPRPTSPTVRPSSATSKSTSPRPSSAQPPSFSPLPPPPPAFGRRPSLSHFSIHQASSISIAPEPSIEKEVMEELMVKIEKMDFEKQQLEAEKLELTEKKKSLQQELLAAQKDAAVAKVSERCNTKGS